MRSVTKKKMSAINTELDRLKALCNQQSDFKSQLQEAVQEFADNYRDDNGRSFSDYFQLINESANNLENEISDIITKIESYSDHRSGRWQESEMGSKYRTWFEQWSELNHAIGSCSLSDDSIAVNLEMNISEGVDDFIEPPSMNVSEVEPSYSCW